jgi:hypothetical protein
MATKKKTKKRPVRATKKRPVAKRAKPAAKKKKRVARAKPAAKKKKRVARAKPVAKKNKKTRAKAKRTPVRRRDGAGHLDPTYAATLREKSDEPHARDADEAFIGGTHSNDDLAEEMGETWVQTATSGEDENQDVLEQEVPEETGGPFVQTTGAQEFAHGTDPSNPKGAKREPFPRT